MTKLFRGAILGAPGSGKGTLSSRIVKKFDIYHLSTGDVLRQSVESGGDLGKSVKKYMAEGKLVPDDLITELVLSRLTEISDKNWLLDGYPRTLAQAEKLLMTHPLDLVISLKVPFNFIIERVKGRWVHLPSGRIYNTTYNPPKVPGKDDVTGEPLFQRPDDNPEAFQKRLEVYLDFVKPLLEYYKKKNVLREFEGTTSNELWPLIEKELLKFMKPKV